MGRCAKLSDLRPRLRLWLDRKAPRLRDGHPGQTDRAPLTMAARASPRAAGLSTDPCGLISMRMAAGAASFRLFGAFRSTKASYPRREQFAIAPTAEFETLPLKRTRAQRWRLARIEPRRTFWHGEGAKRSHPGRRMSAVTLAGPRPNDLDGIMLQHASG